MRRKDLARPDNINILWEICIHCVSTVRDGMVYLMSIKDCFNKKRISYEFSKTCTAKDWIKAVENVYVIKFPDGNHHELILRTDNGLQYISGKLKNAVKILGIRTEYIQKHTPEDNGDIESFHNSLKTDYIWPNDLETFDDTENLMEYAFNDYNSVKPHSSIEYLLSRELKRKFLNDPAFRNRFEKK